MSQMIKCPGDSNHFAGVNAIGVKKHIYSCRYLKQREQVTLVYQCQYCLINFFLSKDLMSSHYNECTAFKKEIPWCESMNLIKIMPDPKAELNEQKAPPKNWEFYRNYKQQKKKEKQQMLLNLGCLDSPDTEGNPPCFKKKLKLSEQQQIDISAAEQTQLRQLNEEKMLENYRKELRTKFKVDSYKSSHIFD